MVVHRHECAVSVVIAGEIKKIGTSRCNGNLHDLLIGRLHEPYFQAHCNLSHVS